MVNPRFSFPLTLDLIFSYRRHPERDVEEDDDDLCFVSGAMSIYYEGNTLADLYCGLEILYLCCRELAGLYYC